MGKQNLIDVNYIKVNEISAKCMRIIGAFLLAVFGYCVVVTDIDVLLLIIFFSAAIIVSLIPTLVINVLKFNNSPITKYIVILSVCSMSTLLLTLLSSFAYPIMIFPILIASLYYNQTLVLFSSLMITIGIMVSTYFSTLYNDVLTGGRYTEVSEAMMHLAVPHIVICFVMSIVAYFIVQRNTKMVKTAVQTAEQMEENQKGLVYSFAEISESKSKFTGEHIKRVAEYMRVLGRASGFDEEYLDKLATASMMHDIGKLMISEEILDKPDRLTDEEYQIMKNHVLYGEALLEKCPGELMHLACVMAKEHHEKWDGTGYLGYKGEQISYISRLIALADVFDALTSTRYYKKGWSLEETFDEIIKLSGKHFDPQVVKLFITHFDEFREIHNSIPDKQVY